MLILKLKCSLISHSFSLFFIFSFRDYLLKLVDFACSFVLLCQVNNTICVVYLIHKAEKHFRRSNSRSLKKNDKKARRLAVMKLRFMKMSLFSVGCWE